MLSAGSNPLSDIGTFCLVHREKIAEEIVSLVGTNTGKWILDLTSTSLFSLLSYWGDRFYQLDVYCDDSKPLHQTDMFDHMVNRLDRVYQRWGDKERLITFNLTRPPQMVRSEDYFGVQIADVLASALRHALENQEAPEAKSWLEQLMPYIGDGSVWPDFDTLDLNTPEAFVNGMLLHELTARSIKRKNLFDGIPAFIAAAHASFPRFQRGHRKRKR